MVKINGEGLLFEEEEIQSLWGINGYGVGLVGTVITR